MTPTPLPFTPAELDALDKIAHAAIKPMSNDWQVAWYKGRAYLYSVKGIQVCEYRLGEGQLADFHASCNPVTALRLIALARVSLDRDRTQAIVDAARALMQSIPETIRTANFKENCCVACSATTLVEWGTPLPIEKHDDGCAWEAMHNLLYGTDTARKAGEEESEE